MAIVFQKTKGLTDKETHYCPGCTHGIIHKLVAESLVELGLLDDMQDEVRKLREEMGEESVKEEQQKMIKPMLDAIKREQ